MNFETILVSLLVIYLVATIIELAGLHRFNLRYFDNGFKIYKREISYHFSNWTNLDGIYSEKEGNYVFLPELKMGYFVSRYRFFRGYSLIAYSRGFPLTIQQGKMLVMSDEIEKILKAKK